MSPVMMYSLACQIFGRKDMKKKITLLCLKESVIFYTRISSYLLSNSGNTTVSSDTVETVHLPAVYPVPGWI